MALFANRAEIRREFYQLVGSVSDDQALTEQGESEHEIANRCIQYGVWNAQQYLIDCGLGERFRTVSDALSWTESPEGAYAVLPADCLRVAGDERDSALRKSDGEGWGTQVTERDRFRVRGAYYYLLDRDDEERLWLARGANPPSPVYLHYYWRHPEITGDDAQVAGGEIVFPEPDRPMIAAEAAYYGMFQSWFTGDASVMARITANRDHWRSEARARTRRSRQARRTRTVRGTGTHWWI